MEMEMDMDMKTKTNKITHASKMNYRMGEKTGPSLYYNPIRTPSSLDLQSTAQDLPFLNRTVLNNQRRSARQLILRLSDSKPVLRIKLTGWPTDPDQELASLIRFLKPWVCLPIAKGGLGLFSAVNRSGPLQAKLAWNFLQQPKSLFNQNLSVKYGNDLLFGDCKRGSSCVWKILKDGAVFLKPLIRWSLANGSKVNVVEDTWIWDRSLLRWPTYADIENMLGMKVSSFLLHTGEWNVDLLQNFFGKELVQHIVQIPVDQDMKVDKPELVFQLSGKTITALAFEKSSSNESGVENKDDRLCPRGCLHIENIEHVAVGCSFLHDVVSKLNQWGFHIHRFVSWDECILELERKISSNANGRRSSRREERLLQGGRRVESRLVERSPVLEEVDGGFGWVGNRVRPSYHVIRKKFTLGPSFHSCALGFSGRRSSRREERLLQGGRRVESRLVERSPVLEEVDGGFGWVGNRVRPS
ncbi:hypothetical protein M5K25_014926 [Dendrobium thyrsiflorum]|uniref:Reverse transcriptase zinc-binding domain-containing protein n=1 Tax=Dendrobium thyrsiflorum TaxID=117978 RepID=A0ABD0UP18_DENTH